MFLRIGLAIALCLSCFAAPAGAQQAAVEPLEIGESGEAYLKSIRYRRIGTDVAYYDPTRPAPPLETTETPRQRSQNRDAASAELPRMPAIILTAGILLLITYLFMTFGGGISVSLGRAAENTTSGRRRRGSGGRHGDQPVLPDSLEAVLRIRDRREALVALAQAVLARTVGAQGVLMQRSWTARDALRRVPRNLEHREALQSLVLAGERVQFGGRDVSEEEFDAHVARIRPLFRRALP
ncbi:hypothetical protein AIOL_000269 [Candidatus Rhodobacter oscarellae]|uniref:Protein-glutamine gamma-glutamyltransferase-like C-terminal domain-containing protein n=1 Tax=Candidatus Rhodobacter oscarellae TaxID=1675527 RepID=A0A0J9EBJ4_9RHOB|nr:DUF4129 domain-containing protein [Candidatus Rhodobacter lobularis]KMW60117.1 hypothetical protein AIOL_000269 [Candidatus Rhodobacter lobularis]